MDDGVAAEVTTTVTVRDLLRHREIGRLAAAELCSSLGSAMVGIAITYLAYRTTGSLVHTVFITAAYTLPAAVLSVPAGRLADHHSRRRVLMVLWTAKAASYLVMAGLSATGTLTSGWLLVTSLVAGSLSAMTFPAWEEYEKDLVPSDLLVQVNGLFSSASSAAALTGAIVGAVIVSAVGETAVFVLNGLTFIPLIVVVALTHPVEVVNRNRSHPGRLRATIHTIRTTGALRRPILNIAALSLLAAPIGQLLPAIAKDLSGGTDATTLGFVTAVFAAGASLVVFVIGRLRHWFDRPGMVEISFITCSVVMTTSGVIALALGSRRVGLYLAVVLVLIPVGLAISVCQSATAAILQSNTAAADQGAVFAIYGIAYTTLAPLGALTLGRLAQDLDIWGVVTLVGVLLGLYSIFVLITITRARGNGELPPPPTPSALSNQARPWGLLGGLFAHADHRMPLIADPHDPPTP